MFKNYINMQSLTHLLDHGGHSIDKYHFLNVSVIVVVILKFLFLFFIFLQKAEKTTTTV